MTEPFPTASPWTRRIFAPLSICAIALGILLLSTVGYIKAAEHWTADWRTALFSKRNVSQDKNVALVLVTEDTLADSSVRIPMDRHLTAKIIRAVASAKPAAIGIDFIYARPTDPDADADLLAAIKDAQVPIVVGTVDENSTLPEKQLAFHRKFLAETGRPGGHVFFERRLDPFAISDQTIRSMATDTRFGVPALALVMARFKKPDAKPRNATIAWLLTPEDGSQPFYEVDAGDIIGDAEDAQPLLAPLAGKLVLFGSDLADVDRHLTPLSVSDDARVPGVLIHANILAQLLDGRSIERFGRISELALLLAMTTLGYAASRIAIARKFPKLLALAGSAALVILGFGVFKYAGYIVPYTSGLAAWVAGISFGAHRDQRYAQLMKFNTLFSSKGRFSWRVFQRLGWMSFWR